MIKIKVNLKNITRELETYKPKLILALSEQILKDSNYYIPKEDGTLERSSLTHSNLEKGEIIWMTPYARKLYYNPQFNFRKDKNLNASGLWFEKAKAERIKDWENIGKGVFK